MEKSKYKEALEIVGSIFVPFTCNGDGDKDYCHLRDNNDYEETYNVLQEAIAKANKYDELMTPKKPLDIRTEEGCYGPSSDTTFGHCPICGEYLELGTKFCSSCGQALDWEGK